MGVRAWTVAVALLVCVASAGCASPASPFVPSTLSGGYLADGRPEWLEYLNLTQSDQAVNGSMVHVQPDGKGGTKSTTVPVLGTTDGTTVSLTASAFFNLVNVSISGKRTGDVIVLTGPDDTGKMRSVSYRRAGTDAFNQMLEAWQKQLATDYQRAAAAQATQQTAAAQR